MSTREPPSLAQIDMNLLVALDWLLRERSVTVAAKRMAVTQSAMSQTLARLRALLDDPLLVRVGTTMEPTDYALGLAEPLHEALDGLTAVLRRRSGFDPATARHVFTVATTDSIVSLFLPRLAERLAERAPQVEFRVVTLGIAVEEPLRAGDIDLVIGAIGPAPALRSIDLFDESFRVVARERHPILTSKDRLAAFCSHRHVLVGRTSRGQGAVDLALAKLDRTRTIAIRVPFLLAAPPIVAATDLLLTAPRRALEQIVDRRVVLIEPPFDLPGFTVRMHWHVRADRDPANRWLRDLMVELCG
ncbi:LysR family transcriptional regulator [Nannocystaceae bacterium ST9]